MGGGEDAGVHEEGRVNYAEFLQELKDHAGHYKEFTVFGPLWRCG